MSTYTQKNTDAICGFNEDSSGDLNLTICNLNDLENGFCSSGFWSRNNLACSSGSLGTDLLFSSLGNVDSATSSDALHVSGFSLIGSSTSLGALLHSAGDLELKEKCQSDNCLSENHGHMPRNKDTVAESLWCRSNEVFSLIGSSASLDALLHSKGDLNLEENCSFENHGHMQQNMDTVAQSVWCRDNDDESLNSKASKRCVCPKSQNTLKQIDADTAPAKRPKQSSKRNGDKRVTSKAGKRRVRSKPKKTLARAAKQPKKTSKRSIRKWTKEEDARLEEGVKLFKIPHWSLIANHVKTRTNKMCAQRWRYALRPENKSINKGTWSKEEDQSLRRVASKYEIKNERAWDMISESMGFTRSNIQCRERWINFLDPTLNLGPWTTEEDARLRSLYKECGNCWKKFTSEFVGRSAMHIRRRFKILKRGTTVVDAQI